MVWDLSERRAWSGCPLGALALLSVLGCGGGAPDAAQPASTPTPSASVAASAPASSETGRPTDDEAPQKPRASVKIHWLVERVTRNKLGKTIADGPIHVSLVAAGDVAATARVGDAVGDCSTHATFGMSSVCDDPTSQALSQLVCGGEHVDHIICYDAVRTDEGIQVTRRQYNILGGKPKLEKSGSVKDVKLPVTARVSYSPADEQKSISE